MVLSVCSQLKMPAHGPDLALIQVVNFQVEACHFLELQLITLQKPVLLQKMAGLEVPANSNPLHLHLPQDSPLALQAFPRLELATLKRREGFIGREGFA